MVGFRIQLNFYHGRGTHLIHKQKPSLSVVMVISLALFLAACGGAVQSPPETAVLPTEEAPLVEVTATSQPEMDIPATPSVTAAAPQELEPTTKPSPQPRLELEASDPASYVRVIGKPQLVEFFAFW
jgi:hypothetical protein